MTAPLSVLDRLKRVLAPENVRPIFNAFHEERERFVPRMIRAASYDEMVEELARFYIAAQERWFHSPGAFDLDRARGAVVQILNRRLGDGSLPKAGEFRAARIARWGEQGGLRRLLDIVTDHLIDTALATYLDGVVMPLVNRLKAEELMILTGAYAGEFADPLSGPLDSPASLALRVRQILRNHLWNAWEGGS